jgi:hypothetical protein
MPFYLWTPYYLNQFIVWLLFEMNMINEGNSTYQKFYGNGGVNPPNFLKFINGLRKCDPQTYWFMTIATNAAISCIFAGCIFLMI